MTVVLRILPDVDSQSVNRETKGMPQHWLRTIILVISSLLLPVWAQETKVGPPIPGVVRSEVEAVAISRDGKRIACGGRDGVLVWDPETEVARNYWVRYGAVRALAFSPDGRLLAAACEENTVLVWDVETRKVLHDFDPGQPVQGVAWSPDGKKLVSSGGTVKLWDLASEQVKVIQAFGGARQVVWSGDGRLIAVSGANGRVVVWDTSTWKDRTFKGHRGEVLAVALSGDGKWIATGGQDGEVHLFDTASGKIIHSLKVASTARVVAFNASGTMLAFGDGAENPKIRILDLVAGTELKPLTGHPLWVNSIAFTFDGSALISGSRDGTVRKTRLDVPMDLRTWAPFPEIRFEILEETRTTTPPEGLLSSESLHEGFEFCILDASITKLKAGVAKFGSNHPEFRLSSDKEHYWLVDFLWPGKKALLGFQKLKIDEQSTSHTQVKQADYTAVINNHPALGVWSSVTLFTGRPNRFSLVFKVPKGVPLSALNLWHPSMAPLPLGQQRP